MKKILIVFAIVFAVYHAASLPVVLAQAKADEITAEEKKAATELGDRFVKRLAETGDVEPLIKEMFAVDFMARYVKEKQSEFKAKGTPAGGVMFATGLQYESSLLDTATEDDWQKLYINTTNILTYSFVFVFNANARSIMAGEEVDDVELEQAMARIYPPAAAKLLKSHIILRNFLQMGPDHRPIKDVAELREVNRLLTEVNRLLMAKPEGKMTADTKAVMKKAMEKLSSQLPPDIEICDRECFAFEKGTRLITLFATPVHGLVIAKVGAEYRIITAQVTSPD